MYLRRVLYAGAVHYVLRETLRVGGHWKYRDLIDLGVNPAEHIRYTDGNGFYFNPQVEEALDASGVDYSAQELEDVFLPFLKHRIRRVVESSQNSHKVLNLSRACSEEERSQYTQELHSFDKRRLHFLRFGHVDMGRFDGKGEKSWKLFNVLLCKCRDEIESLIEEMEQKLPHEEVGSYIYTALNLQTYFANHILRNHPVGLDREKLDEYFLEEICRLNQDSLFFAGVDGHNPKRLHPFLGKYVILYFDQGFPAASFQDEFMREFQWRRQFHRRLSSAKPSIELQEALAIFKLTQEEFKRMDRKDLMRRYRRRAKGKHPDRGGDHDAFVRLTEAYEFLLSRK